MIAPRFIIAGLLALLATGSGAAIVEGPESLAEALRAASPGSVLRLGPGTYGTVRIDGVQGPLLVTATRPEDPPTFGGLVITDSSGITFDTVTIDYTAAPTRRSGFPRSRSGTPRTSPLTTCCSTGTWPAAARPKIWAGPPEPR